MCIFFNENCCILIKFSLKYVRKGPIDNNPALVQIMAWRRSDDKPLSEPMMVCLLMHICVARPQWVNTLNPDYCNLIQIAPKFVSKGSIYSKSSLVQMIAWCQIGAKPFPDPVMTQFTNLYNVSPYLVAVSLQLYQFSICPLCTVFFNTLRPRENGFHFPDNIFKCIFLNEKIRSHGSI